MLPIGLAFLAGIALARACADPGKLEGWYTVCDYDKRQCILSGEYCPPYNSSLDLLFSGDLGIQGSFTKPWTIYIDPYTDALTCLDVDMANPTGCHSNCVKWTGDNPTTSDIQKYMLCLIQKSGSTIYEWGGTSIPSKMSNVIIKSADVNDKAKFKLNKSTDVLPKTNAVRVPPLCRVMEFMGENIQLQYLTLDITECQKSFKREMQYDGDDTAMLVFSGASAAGVWVSEMEFHALPGASKTLSMQSTAIRFQENDNKEQIIDNVTFQAVSFPGVDYPVMFWNAKRPPHIVGTSPSINLRVIGNCDTSQNCSIYWKQADRDPPNITKPQDDQGVWEFINITTMLGPAAALYAPQQLMPVRNENRCASNSEAVWLATLIVASLALVVGIFILIRHCIDAHKADYNARNFSKKEERDKKQK